MHRKRDNTIEIRKNRDENPGIFNIPAFESVQMQCIQKQLFWLTAKTSSHAGREIHMLHAFWL